MKFTRNEIAAIKRVAMTVQPLLKKKDRINEQISELNAKKDEIDEEIKTWELGIKNRTGYGIEELVEREVVNGVTKFKVREDLFEDEQPEVQLVGEEKADALEAQGTELSTEHEIF